MSFITNTRTNISEKLNIGSQPPSAVPASLTFSRKNLRQHTDRFGSKDVYQVNLLPQTTTPGINPTDDVQNKPRVDDVSAAQSIDLEQRTVSVQNKNMLASDDSFAYEQEEAVDCEPIKAPSKEYLLPEAAAASTSQHRQSPPPHRSRRLTNRS
ncbi:hypothetical protein quinque_015136 [Culex quinquefasciatus]